MFSTIDFLLFVSEEGNSKQGDACPCGVALSLIVREEFRRTNSVAYGSAPSAAFPRAYLDIDFMCSSWK